MPETIIRNKQDWHEFWGDIHTQWNEINYDPLLNGVLKDLQQLHSNYFASEVGPAGHRWPELAPSTIARKGHSEILVDSERLRESLVNANSDSIREVFSEGTNHGLRYGTDVEWAQYHNEDTDGRPHVGMSEPDVDAIAERSIDFALEAMKL